MHIQPAAIAFNQIGQQRGQVKDLTFHLSAQAEQPRSFAPLKRQAAVFDGHAVVGKTGCRANLPALCFQEWHLLGPEVGKLLFLGQGPERPKGFATLITVTAQRQVITTPLQYHRRQQLEPERPQLRVIALGLRC